MARKETDDHFTRVRDAAAGLPGVEQGTSYGTPALKVRGKMFVRMKEDGETLVVETDNYKGWPAVLMRLKRISTRKLQHRLEQAWRLKAPKTLIAEFEKGR
jgi:hypothetical protein